MLALSSNSAYPFYATTLPCVANILFQQNEMGAIFLNPAAFGELVVIVRHIEAEPVVVQFWSDIHPRIVNVSHELYVDGHYSTAAEKAVKEVESRLREKFLELKTGAAVPAKIGDVIGALMSENGAFKFCDTTTTSGRNYRRGIHSLFEGIMAAYTSLFTQRNEVYSGSEATVFHLVKLFALQQVLRHNCPIIVDSFRAEDLSTGKEKTVLEISKSINNQVILITTLKHEELGKYDSIEGVNHINYISHIPSKILDGRYVADFLGLLSALSIKVQS